MVYEKEGNRLDRNLMAVVEKRIDRTIGNLKNNKMDAYYAETCADAVALVRQRAVFRAACACG